MADSNRGWTGSTRDNSREWQSSRVEVAMRSIDPVATSGHVWPKSHWTNQQSPPDLLVGSSLLNVFTTYSGVFLELILLTKTRETKPTSTADCLGVYLSNTPVLFADSCSCWTSIFVVLLLSLPIKRNNSDGTTWNQSPKIAWCKSNVLHRYGFTGTTNRLGCGWDAMKCGSCISPTRIYNIHTESCVHVYVAWNQCLFKLGYLGTFGTLTLATWKPEF